MRLTLFGILLVAALPLAAQTPAPGTDDPDAQANGQSGQTGQSGQPQAKPDSGSADNPNVNTVDSGVNKAAQTPEETKDYRDTWIPLPSAASPLVDDADLPRAPAYSKDTEKLTWNVSVDGNYTFAQASEGTVVPVSGRVNWYAGYKDGTVFVLEPGKSCLLKNGVNWPLLDKPPNAKYVSAAAKSAKQKPTNESPDTDR